MPGDRDIGLNRQQREQATRATRCPDDPDAPPALRQLALGAVQRALRAGAQPSDEAMERVVRELEKTARQGEDKRAAVQAARVLQQIKEREQTAGRLGLDMLRYLEEAAMEDLMRRLEALERARRVPPALPGQADAAPLEVAASGDG